MKRLFKAFLFKITKDLTFRITLIIGGGLALLQTFLLLALQYGILAMDGMGDLPISFISGQGMLVTSLSPGENFGLAIPVNLVSFICLEFTHGTIRNKIIAGHSKFKIYLSLFLSGLVFAFALLSAYALLCTALGSIFGGFDLSKMVYILLGTAKITPEYLIKYLVAALFVYTSIVSFTVFISTLTRQIGPSIPIVVVLLLLLYSVTSISSAMALIGFENEAFNNFLCFANPVHALCYMETITDVSDGMPVMVMSNFTFTASLVGNSIYAGLFFFFGSLIFRKRDIK